MKLQTVLLSLVLLGATIARADDISLGYPTTGGSGCPAGTASASLTEDGKALSILFDSFLATAGGSSANIVDQKSCNISIPVHVPNGLSVSIVSIDYRGYTYVPFGGTARLSAEYFFAGSQGPRLSKTFASGTEGDYLFRNDLLAQAIVWSPCGVDVNLRVSASMMARTNSRREQVLATVDSADVSAGIIYRIQTRRCN